MIIASKNIGIYYWNGEYYKQVKLDKNIKYELKVGQKVKVIRNGCISGSGQIVDITETYIKTKTWYKECIIPISDDLEVYPFEDLYKCMSFEEIIENYKDKIWIDGTGPRNRKRSELSNNISNFIVDGNRVIDNKQISLF